MDDIFFIRRIAIMFCCNEEIICLGNLARFGAVSSSTSSPPSGSHKVNDEVIGSHRYFMSQDEVSRSWWMVDLDHLSWLSSVYIYTAG